MNDKTLEATNEVTFVAANPRGTVHTFRNDGEAAAKILAVFSPAGMEGRFAAAFDAAADRLVTPPPPTPAMLSRMVQAAPDFGVAFV
ncbi:MAG: cupin domain-containing protein [Anaerolineae bacterium]|nr:cupin domain-containing protein [Anaerolineae bacterium]